MSKLIKYANSALLSVASVTVTDMNSIIFNSKLVANLPGLTKDGGKFYRLNTRKNTAEEITPATISKSAKKALKRLDDTDSYLTVAEDYGLIQSISFERNPEGKGGCSAITSITKQMGMKITDVVVDVQNAIIFKTTGINDLSDLTKDGSDYYQLDTKRNTATLIDAVSVAKQARKDLLKGKTTDFTQLADSFNLISSITFERADA